MVLHNPNNWHWVNKDASSWTRDWLDTCVKGIHAEGGGVTARLDKIVSMEGDVDVSQRKGKVITIFDVKLVLEYTGIYRQGRADAPPPNPPALIAASSKVTDAKLAIHQGRRPTRTTFPALSQSLRSPMTLKRTSLSWVPPWAK